MRENRTKRRKFHVDVPSKPVMVLVALVGSFVLMGCSKVKHVWDDPSQMQEAHLFDDPLKINKKLHGVWSSKEYGWLLSISDNRVSMFDITSSGCTSADELLKENTTYYHTYALTNSGDQLGLRGKFEQYTYYFSRVDGLPDRCVFTTASTPLANFDFLSEAMRQHYAFFSERGVDWEEIVETNASQISDSMTDDELWDVFKDMLRPIDDGHVTITRDDEGRQKTFRPGRGRTQNSIIPLAKSIGREPGGLFGEWYEDYKLNILEGLLSGGGKIVARERLIYGMIDNEIGYINIIKMGGFVDELGWGIADFHAERDALNAALNEALSHMKHAKGIVVDVTDNGGGFDFLAQTISARFTTEKTLGSFRSPTSGELAKPQAIYSYPSERVSFYGPVVVLSSNLTVSAGESFIMHMRELPNVTHMGESTRGALSEVLPKTLPNGWSVSISNESYLDGQGVLWEAKGIPPEIELQIFNPDNIFEGHLDAVRQAAAFLKQD